MILNRIIKRPELLLIPLVFLWTGLTAGISFMEAPLKFRAPDVTLKIGVGIGHIVFSALNLCETILAILSLLPMAALYRSKRFLFYLMVFVYILLTFQSAYLLPRLDERIERIMQGEFLLPSSLHKQYIAADVAKLLLLLWVGVSLMKDILHEKGHKE